MVIETVFITFGPLDVSDKFSSSRSIWQRNYKANFSVWIFSKCQKYLNVLANKTIS